MKQRLWSRQERAFVKHGTWNSYAQLTLKRRAELIETSTSTLTTDSFKAVEREGDAASEAAESIDFHRPHPRRLLWNFVFIIPKYSIFIKILSAESSNLK